MYTLQTWQLLNTICSLLPSCQPYRVPPRTSYARSPAKHLSHTCSALRNRRESSLTSLRRRQSWCSRSPSTRSSPRRRIRSIPRSTRRNSGRELSPVVGYSHAKWSKAETSCSRSRDYFGKQDLLKFSGLSEGC